MATHRVETQATTGTMKLGRTVLLTSLGAFGVASDHVNRIIHLDTLFKIFVRRGERVEKSVLTFVRRDSSNVGQLAAPRDSSHTR